MVPSIARQSVIIKCNMGKSVITGNYEYYYAAGLVSKVAGTAIDDEIKPLELQELLEEKLPGLTAQNEQETYLFALLSGYRPTEEYDEQMKELLQMGKNENYMWTVTILS